MKQATVDRGEIIDVAGRQGLSPALRGGAPALASGHGDAARCGWEPFFAALESRGLALVWDPGDPASTGFAPRGEVALRGHGSPGGLARTRRFLGALLGRGETG